MAGRLVPFTVEDTKQWDLKMIQSMFKARRASEAKHVSRVGFNLVTGLIRPREAIMMPLARIIDVASRLTAVKRLDSHTMWARIEANGGERADRDGLLQAAFETDAGRAADNRVLLSFHMMKDIGLRITANAFPWWSQNVQTLNVNDHMQNWNFWNPYYSRYTLRKNRQTISVDAFTDGSTVPGGLAPSGVGIVLKDTVTRQTLVEVAEVCKASGNNYMAEALAVLGAVQDDDSLQAELTVYTDSAALIWALLGLDKLSPGRYMRMGARSIVRAIGRLIAARTGITTLRHVRSHTGSDDYRSQGNARGDCLANQAREAGADAPLPWMLEGEEKFVFWSDGRHVIGDLRAEMRRLQATRNFNKWKTQSHQGRVARATGMYLLSHCRDIRRLAFAARAPDMVLFLVLALCEWLPTRGRDSHRSDKVEDRICLWCSHRAIDDSWHALSCASGGVGVRNRRRNVDRILACLPPTSSSDP